MIAGSTLLKSCATPPASWPDRLHLLALRELLLELRAARWCRARRGSPPRRRRRSSLDRASTQTRAERPCSPASGSSSGGISLRLSPAGFERRVDLRSRSRSRERPRRSSGPRRLRRCAAAAEQAREGRVRLQRCGPCRSTVAMAIGVLLKKRAKRTSAARCPSSTSSPGAAVEHQRARRARACRPGRRRRGDRAAPAGTGRCGGAGRRRRSRCARSPGSPRRTVIISAPTLPRHDVGETQAAGAELGEIVAEPGGERRVQVDDVARRIDREEAGRRMVEIVDRVLQLLEDVLLPLALVRDVGDRPQRRACGRCGGSGRTRTRYQPNSCAPSRDGESRISSRAACAARAPPGRGGRSPRRPPARR